MYQCCFAGCWNPEYQLAVQYFQPCDNKAIGLLGQFWMRGEDFHTYAPAVQNWQVGSLVGQAAFHKLNRSEQACRTLYVGCTTYEAIGLHGISEER